MTNQLDATADRLHSLAIHLLRRVRSEDARSGLSPARLSALSVVVFAGPLSLGELAEAEQVTPPTMSRLVAALESEGLVSRAPDPEDARSVRIVATPAGRNRLETARGRRLRRMRELLTALSPEELDAVDRASRSLAATLEEAPRARAD